MEVSSCCQKCGYVSGKLRKKFDISLCAVCSTFTPSSRDDFKVYIAEKLDWRVLDTFRKHNVSARANGMRRRAEAGGLVVRPPMGYGVQDGLLVPNEDASKIHSLFRTFLNRKYSLNSLARNFGVSTNGLKKILSNRVYLGETKFAGGLYKSSHKQLVSPEVFYAVQRKLKMLLRPRN